MDKSLIKPIQLKDIRYITDPSDSFVTTTDDHFYYGIGFFETIMVTDKGLFIDEHILRLNQSLAQFGLNKSLSANVVHEFIKTNNLRNIGLKILVTHSGTFASCRNIHYTDEYYTKGADLTVSPIIKSSRSHLITHKSTNYGDNILELRRILKEGYNDIFFMNEHQHITESSIANLFILKDGQIITPPVSDGLLPGIVRQVILNSYDVIEQSLTLDEILASDGAFLTNSLVGVIKINTINKTKLKEDPLVDEIRKKYELIIQRS